MIKEVDEMARKDYRVEQVDGSTGLGANAVRKAKSASAGGVSKIRQEMRDDARRNPAHGSDWVRVSKR